MQKWLDEKIYPLEGAYIQHEEPWKQSGFSGPEERWFACRKPVADCIDRRGSLLDIGCANGYLLECILKWKDAENIQITPYGLDLSPKLLQLAQKRLPKFTDNFYSGNAWDWTPHQQFDFVRTELVYVPDELRKDYINRLLSLFIHEGGKLIVAEYLSGKVLNVVLRIDEVLTSMGFKVNYTKSGYYDGKEMIRLAVIEKEKMQ